MFSAEQRLHMVRAGCSHLPNVLVHPSGPYMVSSATFPTYFLKEKQRTEEIHCELDVRLFGEKIAPALGITRRYAGTEPCCPVTARYNAQMKQLLPRYGVELREIERKTADGSAISASRAREMLSEGKRQELGALLPESTLRLLCSKC